jgi:hypothetical protein
MSKTSSKVKRKYNSKTYTTVRADLPKQLVTNFTEVRAERGHSVAAVIRQGLVQYIDGSLDMSVEEANVQNVRTIDENE